MKHWIVSVLILSSMFIVPASYAQQAPVGLTTPTAPVSATTEGMKITDPVRGVEFIAPNSTWGINASQHTISLTHSTYYDSHVTLKKSWYSVPTAQEAYIKRKDSLKSYLPGAIFVKENETLTLGAATPAVSMTYKNPSDLKVKREIMFIHKNQAYELVFEAKEENFPAVKEDFGFILRNLKFL